jgi:hypothetical protein
MTLTVAERLPLVLCCCIGFSPAPISVETKQSAKIPCVRYRPELSNSIQRLAVLALPQQYI